MSRRSVAIRWFALTAIFASIATLCAVLVPASANALDPVPASLTVTASDLTADNPSRTIAVGVDPGDSDLAALAAELVYDTTKITLGSCSVSEAGACNVISDDQAQGTVKVSVFNLNGLEENEQLLTVDFVPTADATGSTTLSLVIVTAADTTGSVITVAGTESEILVSTQPDEQSDSSDSDSEASDQPAGAPGSLTGDVTSALDSTGLYGVSVCATKGHSASCTTTNGWGAWRIDDLAAGEYNVKFTESSGIYADAEVIAEVVAGEITTAIDVLLDVEREDGPKPEQDETATAPESDQPANETETEADADQRDRDIELEVKEKARSDASRPTPKTSVYQASIAGTVRAAGSVTQVVGVQVCASQAHELAQSCASTDVYGAFELTGLTTGNYLLTIVDPLGRYEMGNERLVGISTDQARRDGIVLVANAIG